MSTSNNNDDNTSNYTGDDDGSIHSGSMSHVSGEGGGESSNGEDDEEDMTEQQLQQDGTEDSGKDGEQTTQNYEEVLRGDDDDDAAAADQYGGGDESEDSVPTKKDSESHQNSVFPKVAGFVQREERTPAFNKTYDSSDEEAKMDPDGTPIRSGSRLRARRVQGDLPPNPAFMKKAQSPVDESEFHDARENESPGLVTKTHANDQGKTAAKDKRKPPIQKDTVVHEVKVMMDEKLNTMRNLTDKLLGDLELYADALSTAEQTYLKVHQDVHAEEKHLDQVATNVQRAIASLGLPGGSGGESKPSARGRPGGRGKTNPSAAQAQQAQSRPQKINQGLTNDSEKNPSKGDGKTETQTDAPEKKS